LDLTDTQLILLTKTNPELNTPRIYVSICPHVTFAAAAVCSCVAPDTDGVYNTVNGDAFTIVPGVFVGALVNDGVFVGLLVVTIAVGSLVGALVVTGAFVVVLVMVGATVDGAFVGVFVVELVDGLPVCRNIGLSVGLLVGKLVVVGVCGTGVFVGAIPRGKDVGLDVGTLGIPFDGGIVIFVGIMDIVGNLVVDGINVNDDIVVGDIVGLLVGLMVGFLIGLTVRISIFIHIRLRVGCFVLIRRIIPFPLGDDVPFPIPCPLGAFVILVDIIPFSFVDIVGDIVTDGAKFAIIDFAFWFVLSIPLRVFNSKFSNGLGDKLILVV
jgi:hypothetical protein